MLVRVQEEDGYCLFNANIVSVWDIKLFCTWTEGIVCTVICFFFSALGVEPRALHMIITRSASELYSPFYVSVLHITEVQHLKMATMVSCTYNYFTTIKPFI